MSIQGTSRLSSNRGKSVAGTVTLQGNGSPATPIASQNSLESISKFFKLISFPGTWVRIGLIMLGVGLVFFGLLRITGDNQLSETTKAVGKAAVKLAVK